MQKSDRSNLTEGSILLKLLTLSVPVMGTQLVQMAYNLVDMFWLGRLGSGAVAASGTAGFYVWLTMGLMIFGSKGAEIGVSQNAGRRDFERARSYAESALSFSVLLGVAAAVAMALLRGPLVGFFNIREAVVVQDTSLYMLLVSMGVPFTFITSAISGAFTGSGNSRMPFYANLIGVTLNIVIDPLFIFTFNMGIAGAALATVCAQIVCAGLLLVALAKNQQQALRGVRLWALPKPQHIKTIVRWAMPLVVESLGFTFLSMVISRFVAQFGAEAIATQRIGAQVESITWLVGIGFSSAFTAYVGQNFGAGKYARIRRGFKISTVVMMLWGLVATALLYLGAEAIFTLFLPGEPHVIAIGTHFLRLLSICQMAQCLEPIGAGAFAGLGRPVPVSVISITANSARTIAAYILSGTSLGLNGIWLAIVIGSFVRGLSTYLCYLIASAKLPKNDVENRVLNAE